MGRLGFPQRGQPPGVDQAFRGEKARSYRAIFGWLNAWLKPYPDTINLKTRVHFRDDGIRPYIELEPTDHPLAVEQREGVSVDRVAEIYALMVHDSGA